MISSSEHPICDDKWSHQHQFCDDKISDGGILITETNLCNASDVGLSICFKSFEGSAVKITFDIFILYLFTFFSVGFQFSSPSGQHCRQSFSNGCVLAWLCRCQLVIPAIWFSRLPGWEWNTRPFTCQSCTHPNWPSNTTKFVSERHVLILKNFWLLTSFLERICWLWKTSNFQILTGWTVELTNIVSVH